MPGLTGLPIRLVKQLSGRPAAQRGPSRLGRFDPGVHLEEWLRLHYDCFLAAGGGVAWTAARFHREFSPSRGWPASGIIVAESGGLPGEKVQLVGTVAVGRSLSGRWSLNWVAVDPRHRRSGIGRQLVAHAELAIWECGGGWVELETLADWTAAGRFYQKLGYHPPNELPPGRSPP